MNVNDYIGYPCGVHTHATARARAACQGPAILDEIPDLGVKGEVWSIRPPGVKS